MALLVGFAVQAMGTAGEPILRGVGLIQKLVFRILARILWLAPIGAFGAIANVVGQTGWSGSDAAAGVDAAFYMTCAIFVFGILGMMLQGSWPVSRSSSWCATWPASTC